MNTIALFADAVAIAGWSLVLGFSLGIWYAARDQSVVSVLIGTDKPTRTQNMFTIALMFFGGAVAGVFLLLQDLHVISEMVGIVLSLIGVLVVLATGLPYILRVARHLRHSHYRDNN